MVIVLATIELAEGRRDDFLAEFHQVYRWCGPRRVAWNMVPPLTR